MKRKISNIKYQISNKYQLIIENWKLKIENSPHSGAAFTLIELLVAMSIVAILAGAIWGNFFSSLNKARDSKRKQDLQQISKALELYYYDKKAYPQPTQIVWGKVFDDPLNRNSVIYMQKVPSEPSQGHSAYCYSTDTNGTYYQMYASLENTEDSALITPVTCGGVSYNYGIASPNQSP